MSDVEISCKPSISPDFTLNDLKSGEQELCCNLNCAVIVRKTTRLRRWRSLSQFCGPHCFDRHDIYWSTIGEFVREQPREINIKPQKSTFFKSKSVTRGSELLKSANSSVVLSMTDISILCP